MKHTTIIVTILLLVSCSSGGVVYDYCNYNPKLIPKQVATLKGAPVVKMSRMEQQAYHRYLKEYNSDDCKIQRYTEAIQAQQNVLNSLDN